MFRCLRYKSSRSRNSSQRPAKFPRESEFPNQSFSSHIENLFDICWNVIIPDMAHFVDRFLYRFCIVLSCFCPSLRCQVSYQERLVQAERNRATMCRMSCLHFASGWKDSSGRTDHRSRSATRGHTGQAISFFRPFAELRSYQFNLQNKGHLSACVSSNRWIFNCVMLPAVLQMSEQASFGSLSSFSMFSMACAFHIPFAGVSCGSSTAADRWCDSWGDGFWLLHRVDRGVYVAPVSCFHLYPSCRVRVVILNVRLPKCSPSMQLYTQKQHERKDGVPHLKTLFIVIVVIADE